MVASLPSEWYVSPRVWSRERQLIFRSSWQYVGHLDRLSRPGDYLCARIGEIPIVVTRDRSGTINALVNVCRHRLHEVVAGTGNRQTLQCPYHAWTYDLDGSLRAAPRSDREAQFDRREHSLRPVAVATLGPLVFVNPDRRAAPLDRVTAELHELFLEREVPLDHCAFRARREYELGCNWKVYVDNAVECYHCPVAHPGLSARVDVRPEAYRLERHEWFSCQLGHRRGGDATARPDGAPDFQFYYLWPNTFLGTATGAGSYAVHRIDPLDVDRCRLTVEYFFAPEIDAASAQEEVELNATTLHEDSALVESVQRGLRSDAVSAGVLLPSSEALVAHFHDLVRRALGPAGSRHDDDLDRQPRPHAGQHV